MEILKANNDKVVELGTTGYGNQLREINGVTYEVIVLTNGLEEYKEEHVVAVNGDDWYAVKCLEVPQKVARKHLSKGTNRHFELTDLESFLTEEAFKVYVKYDKTKHAYFETYLRKCLGRKAISFFRDTKVDKLTDLESSIMSKNAEEEDSNIEIFDEPIDVWAELHSQWEVEDIIAELEPEEQFIARKLLDGYNSSEIAKELGVYRLKVRRAVNKIVDKAKLEKKKERKTKVNTHLASTTKASTLASVKEYNKLKEKLAVEDKILYTTARVWGMESKLEKELEKLESLDQERRLHKEAELNTYAEVLELAKKDLAELERKLEKFNR